MSICLPESRWDDAVALRLIGLVQTAGKSDLQLNSECPYCAVQAIRWGHLLRLYDLSAWATVIKIYMSLRLLVTHFWTWTYDEWKNGDTSSWHWNICTAKLWCPKSPMHPTDSAMMMTTDISMFRAACEAWLLCLELWVTQKSLWYPIWYISRQRTHLETSDLN